MKNRQKWKVTIYDSLKQLFLNDDDTIIFRNIKWKKELNNGIPQKIKKKEIEFIFNKR